MVTNIQQRISFTMGPLCRLWSLMEGEKTSLSSSPDVDQNQLESINMMSQLFDQTILLLGQAYNSCSYLRMFNVLMSFIPDKKKVESMLKEMSSSFVPSEKTEPALFGPKYEDMVSKFLSSKNKSKELFTSFKKNSSRGSHAASRPFSRGPLFQTRGRGRGFFTAAGQNYNNRGSNRGGNRGSRGMFQFNIRGAFSQLIRDFGHKGLPKCTSFDKKVISNTYSPPASCRKDSILFGELKKADKRSDNVKDRTGIRDTLSFPTKTENCSTPYSYQSRGEIPCGQGGPKYAEKKVPSKGQLMYGGNLSVQFFLWTKKTVVIGQ